ncbi:MAG: hypothetical protein ACOC3V_01210 [bacterium]
MKKTLLLLVLIIQSISIFSQTYSEKIYQENLGVFYNESDENSYIKIESFITKQKIIKHKKSSINKLVGDLPNYRYTIYLSNDSKLKNQSTDVLIDNLKVFIDGIEVTKSQFSDGFSVVIKKESQSIYWYDTNNERINVKINWSSVSYQRE